jgi:hypothetical protein
MAVKKAIEQDVRGVKLNGPLEFYVITPYTIVDLCRKAGGGDPAARASLSGMAYFLKEYVHKRPGKGRMCLMCDYEFNRTSHKPDAFVAIMPMFPSQTKSEIALLCPICHPCFSRHPDFAQAMMDRMRQFWPELDLELVSSH